MTRARGLEVILIHAPTAMAGTTIHAPTAMAGTTILRRGPLPEAASHPGMAPPRTDGMSIQSVWDYPRPPRVESVAERIRAVVDGLTIADTLHAQRVLETSHPPVYYLPREDVRMDLLVSGQGGSVCEWKGRATYLTLELPGRRIVDIAWAYERPLAGYESIAGHLAFYASKLDEAWVGSERATSQPGGFYGGWVTADIVGPFKGGPGSLGW